ncbi:hypothetical protein CCACVL1_07231 [Corchorus capsularis]|uniref:RNase H type-1 domain-containing protein n=1 Tax=Corchorus capsularis TaxID=210143 RepID=A0A1R3J894_COCAP|nr:hypothetical protein CCACVL1_07231 [Corchorus capsularis]
MKCFTVGFSPTYRHGSVAVGWVGSSREDKVCPRMLLGRITKGDYDLAVWEYKKAKAIALPSHGHCRMYEIMKEKEVAAIVKNKEEPKWKAPEDGWIKLNVDGAYDISNENDGIVVLELQGIVARTVYKHHICNFCVDPL